MTSTSIYGTKSKLKTLHVVFLTPESLLQDEMPVLQSW